jgi:hypothetical protein
MALLGHTIVEAGLARLVGLWPHVSRKSHLRLKMVAAQKPDAEALAKANAIYAGQIILTAEDFADLSWLEHFSKSGRQLLMCHALKLLEGWNQQSHNRLSFEIETQNLLRLSHAATRFAAMLDATLLDPLTEALQHHIKRFLALSVSDSTAQLSKALTLLDVATVLEDGANLQKEAAKLLDQCLPKLIAVDGGPLHHSFKDYVTWVHRLLDAVETPIHPQGRNALDRARPFLAMLLDQDRTYCFDRKQKPHADILHTSAMRLAPTSGVARLEAGRALLLSVPSDGDGPSELHLSSHGHWLLSSTGFLHDENQLLEQSSLTAHSSDDGHLIQQSLGQSQRTVFASPKGDDIRIEDIVPKDGLTRWMRLRLEPSTKFSITRNGTIASIALDGRNLWQLTLRGARLMAPNQNGEVLVETTGSHDRINWALRRVTRHATRGPKTDMPELPF